VQLVGAFRVYVAYALRLGKTQLLHVYRKEEKGCASQTLNTHTQTHRKTDVIQVVVQVQRKNNKRNTQKETYTDCNNDGAALQKRERESRRHNSVFGQLPSTLTSSPSLAAPPRQGGSRAAPSDHAVGPSCRQHTDIDSTPPPNTLPRLLRAAASTRVSQHGLPSSLQTEHERSGAGRQQRWLDRCSTASSRSSSTRHRRR
jgi:hypothetical protein